VRVQPWPSFPHVLTNRVSLGQERLRLRRRLTGTIALPLRHLDYTMSVPEVSTLFSAVGSVQRVKDSAVAVAHLII
jgi:hypothetical protein